MPKLPWSSANPQVTPDLKDEVEIENSRKRRSITQIAVGVVVLVAALVVVTGILLLFTPWFKVTTTEVTGIAGAPQAEAKQQLDTELGVPLLTADTSRLVSEIGSLPEVAQVTVVRVWPHTLRAEVVPRSGVGYYEAEKGSKYDLLDSTGVVFAVLTQPPAGLPWLRVAETERVAAAEFAGSLPEQLRNDVEIIERQSDGWYLILRDDRGTVHWGDLEQAQLKSSVLNALLADAERANQVKKSWEPQIDWFDVSVPNAPTTAAGRPVPATPTPTPTPVPTGSSPGAPAVGPSGQPSANLGQATPRPSATP